MRLRPIEKRPDLGPDFRLRESFLLNLALLHAFRRMPALTSSIVIVFAVASHAGQTWLPVPELLQAPQALPPPPGPAVVISPEPFLGTHTTGLSGPSAKPPVNSTTRINRFITPLP